MLALQIILGIQIYLIVVVLIGHAIGRGGRYEDEYDGKEIGL